MQTNLKSVYQKIMLNDLVMMHDRFTLVNEKLMTLLCDQVDPKTIAEILVEVKTASENYLNTFRSLMKEIGDIALDEETLRSLFCTITGIVYRNAMTMDHLKKHLIGKADSSEELTYGE